MASVKHSKQFSQFYLNNMKTAFILLGLVVAVYAACDPDSNNQPQCNANNLGQKVRNFYDPTRYWLCNNSNAAAVAVPCEEGGFVQSVNKCVSWAEWQWETPCPEQS